MTPFIPRSPNTAPRGAWQTDSGFLGAIYKPEKAYATTLATGWITDLFPYLGDSPGRRRNRVLALAREDWALPVRHGVSLKSFPSGLSSVPVKLKVKTEALDLDLVAGFLAVKQDLPDLSLSTVIGWCVAEPPPKTPVLLQRLTLKTAAGTP